MKRAFTMIELVFVIVVVGILAGIAIPKLAVTRDDAIVTKGKATVGALRSAIAMERQKRILKGDFTAIDGATAERLLEYGLDDHWSRTNDVFTFTGPDNKTCKFKVENNKLVKDDCEVEGMEDL
jgi:general secretion pathway protein G